MAGVNTAGTPLRLGDKTSTPSVVFGAGGGASGQLVVDNQSSTVAATATEVIVNGVPFVPAPPLPEDTLVTPLVLSGGIQGGGVAVLNATMKRVGDFVTLNIATFSVNAAGGAALTTSSGGGAAVPASWWPGRGVSFPILVTDNGSQTLGKLAVAADFSLTFFATPGGGGYTAGVGGSLPYVVSVTYSRAAWA